MCMQAAMGNIFITVSHSQQVNNWKPPIQGSRGLNAKTLALWPPVHIQSRGQGCELRAEARLREDQAEAFSPTAAHPSLLMKTTDRETPHPGKTHVYVKTWTGSLQKGSCRVPFPVGVSRPGSDGEVTGPPHMLPAQNLNTRHPRRPRNAQSSCQGAQKAKAGSPIRCGTGISCTTLWFTCTKQWQHGLISTEGLRKMTWRASCQPQITRRPPLKKPRKMK